MESILPGFDTWILIKTLAMILLGMYLIFAFVVTRQVNLMIKTLNLGLNTPIRVLAYLHAAFAVLVFLTALIIL